MSFATLTLACGSKAHTTETSHSVVVLKKKKIKQNVYKICINNVVKALGHWKYQERETKYILVQIFFICQAHLFYDN